jgi:mannitol/fructose-specific phosphotransferase system IIA component (Ntr-type)
MAQPEEVRQRIRSAILQRERTRPTCIGADLAFPHARVSGLSGFVACMATLRHDLDYEAHDPTAVRMVWMVVAPEESPTLALKAMAIVGALMENGAKEVLLAASDPAAVHRYLQSLQLVMDVPITAREVMRRPRVGVTLDTPLRQVTREMLDKDVECVSVSDADGRMVGEITCDMLFKTGVPDFFSQLASVAFIRQFDPFEKYFQSEADARAGDVMSSDFAAVGEEATLMEVVFLLSVRGYPKVYVVRDGRRVGVIDRAAVLDRILNL